ncbi:MAG: alpha/beta fold hydrolase [Actinobacteria bacterium]|nr:alpha/beta fold hydrolase [Actinomycetota bacterium]
MSRDADDFALPLDQLLTGAATGPMSRLFPGTSAVRFLDALRQQPDLVANRMVGLAGELVQIATGGSEVAPRRGDRRFADPAWTENPFLKRLVQAYLATAEVADALVEETPLEWRDAQQMKLAVTNLFQALAPSNNPLLNPVAWKAFIDSGGTSVLKGSQQLLQDMATAPRVPSMVDTEAFTVGVDLAATPGSVVYRTDMFELIQYTPQTETVRAVPLLIIPPTINKYYVLDLAPGRSLIEYLVQQGQQSFVISWRNPGAENRDWGFDAYSEAIIDAFNAVARISGTDSAHVVATCSGGILAALAAAHRAATGQIDRLASLSLLVTMIDQSSGGVTGSLLDENTARIAIEKSQRTGYLDGRDLAEVFAWLRPNDLIWNYWVNNYLQGKKPPKFDILFWNADTTRMPAALHKDFVEAAMGNKFASPGAVEVLGTPIDLGALTVDSYVVAGSADHICPWANCYRSSQLLGGETRFVLSTNGHIAALVNTPDNPKSSYQAGDDNSHDADVWRETTPIVKGSWWPDYAEWLARRSGDTVPAPTTLGSPDFPPLQAAPGSYVLAK